MFRVEIEILITTYYNGHTLDSIQSEIEPLIGLLDDANQTLSNVTINGSDIIELEQSLAQVSTRVVVFDCL